RGEPLDRRDRRDVGAREQHLPRERRAPERAQGELVVCHRVTQRGNAATYDAIIDAAAAAIASTSICWLRSPDAATTPSIACTIAYAAASVLGNRTSGRAARNAATSSTNRSTSAR